MIGQRKTKFICFLLLHKDDDRLKEIKDTLPAPELMKGSTMCPEEFEKVIIFLMKSSVFRLKPCGFISYL